MLINNHLIGFGNATRLNDAVLFDGSTTALSKATDFTGVTDGKQWTFSLWFYRNSATGGTIFGGNDEPVFNIGATGSAEITLYEPGSVSNPLNITFPTSTFATGTWYNIIVSIDLTNASNRHVYVNDSAASVTYASYNNLTCEFSKPFDIGRNDGPSNYFDGAMFDFWMNFNQYLDLSVTANRRKFISASGSPVGLGPEGQNPNGTAPDVFLSGKVNNWHINKGTAGGFTENGTLTLAPSRPL